MQKDHQKDFLHTISNFHESGVDQIFQKQNFLGKISCYSSDEESSYFKFMSNNTIVYHHKCREDGIGGDCLIKYLFFNENFSRSSANLLPDCGWFLQIFAALMGLQPPAPFSYAYSYHPSWSCLFVTFQCFYAANAMPRLLKILLATLLSCVSSYWFENSC